MNNKLPKPMLEVLIITIFLTFMLITYTMCKGNSVNAKDDFVQVIMPNSSNKEMLELLENRNGKLVIEIGEGRVIDDEGNGESFYSDGTYYIYYNTDEFKKGDEVLSIFVYNPDTNYTDDITHRIDIKKQN